jgi:ribonuclease-3
MQDLKGLQQRLGQHWRNENLLRQALVHRSYLNEHPDFPLGHNERLEFLGDAVLELVITEHLYVTYPNPEGELTNWRASLVNADTLAEVARELTIEDYLLLSRGEAQDAKSKARHYILANAMEAIIGSLYLDQGFEACKTLIHRFLVVKLEFIITNKLYLDPKSRFQEAAQEKVGITPAYRVVGESGPDHAKRFEVAVMLGSEQVSVGIGSSKQEAQMDAAEKALIAKGW